MVSDYRARRELPESVFKSEKGSLGVELRSCLLGNRILVPMLYIICREHTCIHPWGWHLHGFRAGGGFGMFFLIFVFFLYNLQSPITAKTTNPQLGKIGRAGGPPPIHPRVLP